MSRAAKGSHEPVMIVDDDALARQILADVATEAGFRPLVASSAEEARVLLVEEPRVLFLDFSLPGITGDVFCHELRTSEMGWQLPVVMVTSHDQSNVIKRCLVAGADDFVHKPLEKSEILSKLAAVRGGGHVGLPGVLGPKKVILATDHPYFVKNVLKLLRASKLEVDLVSGLDSLAKSLGSKVRPQVAVLDLELVGPDGLDLVRRLEGSTGTPLTVITMASGASIRSRASKWASEAPRVWASLAPFDIEEERDDILRHLHRVLALGAVRGTRRMARVPFYSAVRFRWADQPQWSHGIGFDLSESGMFVRTLAPLTPARRTVELSFRVGDKSTVTANALVVWSHPYGPRNLSTLPFGMGLSFNELPADAAEVVRSYVTSRTNKQLSPQA